MIRTQDEFIHAPSGFDETKTMFPLYHRIDFHSMGEKTKPSHILFVNTLLLFVAGIQNIDLLHKSTINQCG